MDHLGFSLTVAWELWMDFLYLYLFLVVFFIGIPLIVSIFTQNDILSSFLGKATSMFKVIFYFLFAVFTLFIDHSTGQLNIGFNVEGGLNYKLPDKITLTQFLLIPISLLECINNFIDLIKPQN